MQQDPLIDDPLTELEHINEELKAENAALRFELESARRMLAMIIHEAGGEVRISGRTQVATSFQGTFHRYTPPVNADIVLRYDEPTRMTEDATG